MMLLRRGSARWALTLVLALGGCAVGGPQRASDIQNLNAISDDIAAVTMTQSTSARARDPNLPTLFPRSYTTSNTR